MSRILVIDDDLDITLLLRKFLTKHGYDVETTYSGREAEKLVASFSPDLIMCDYKLDDMDGSELLLKIKDINPDIPVIIITGYSDLRTAIKVVRLGAFDYITKPLIPDEILLTIKKALDEKNSGSNTFSGTSAQSKTGKAKKSTGYLFGTSMQSKNLEHQISLVAPTNYSVIIYGESGAGKEGVARLIHERSVRKDKPFVAMDCGAISKELAASEMFGHEKGSFTGALNQKTGHFEMAHGGTLFLDEISNLSYETQILLLRVIQEKSVRKVGGNKEVNVDTRLIVASNERLPDSIKRGKFREDLYHRLNEFTIEVPSLRLRKGDILFFAHHFLQEAAVGLGKKLIGFESEVEDVFLNYPWPGNIRELKNVIKRAVLLGNSDRLDVRSLPFEILNHARLEFDVTEPPVNGNGLSKEISPHSNLSHPLKADFSNSNLKDIALGAEYETIVSALTQVNFNKSKAADMLGINRKTLYNKMKQMQLKDK